MTNVSLKGITKYYNDVLAVNNISLQIADREFAVLVGPSGCGKTTILRMIAGLEEIDKGEIYIKDRLVNQLSAKDRNIAMVFQNYALYPHMNVFENMAFGLKMRKTPKTERETLVREAAEILGIEELLDRRPKQLSGGQRQRVALGRAIVRKPDVFLFDEPLSNLDAKLRVQMRTELVKLHKRLKSTSIYVTHDQVEAMTMGDRIVVMNGGIIQQVGSPMTLYNKPANLFVARFIGSPSMNVMPCRIVEENTCVSIAIDSLRIPLPDEMVSKVAGCDENDFIFGVRPEDLTTAEADQKQLGKAERFKAMVNVVETLGKETYLDITVGKQNMTAVIGPNIPVSANEPIELQIHMEKIHLFRKKGEEALF